MNTVTITTEEYNKLRDAMIAYQEIEGDVMVGFQRNWYPNGGGSRTIYIYKADAVSKELLMEIEHLQRENRKYMQMYEEALSSQPKEAYKIPEKPKEKPRRKWWQFFALLPLIALFSCSPTAPLRVIDVQAEWLPQEGSAPMTMDVYLGFSKDLTANGTATWSYEYVELVPPFRRGVLQRSGQFNVNGHMAVINTMDIANPETVNICGFKLLSVTADTDDVLITTNKNYTPCGKY